MYQRLAFILVLSLSPSLPAFAYYSTFDTADIIAPNQHQIGVETQFILNSLPGTNFIAHYDLGATESINYRLLAGGGTKTIQAGAFFKFSPFPDYESQPALGFMTGVLYGNHEGTHALGLRFHPLVSKHINTGLGIFTPYVSVPVGITFASLERTYPSQFVVGTSWSRNADNQLKLLAEYGINMNAAFNYVSAGFLLPLDNTQNFPEID